MWARRLGGRLLCRGGGGGPGHSHCGKNGLYLAPPFIVENYEPVAQEAARTGRLAESDSKAKEHLADCRLCPRDCGVDRMKDLKGACNTGRYAIVSSAFPHFGEESVLQGELESLKKCKF